jgi:hypothetical protein
MAVREAGAVAHRRAVAELEAGLGPFSDAAWREDLALLSHSVRAGALLLARDCEAIVGLASRVPRSPGDERGGTPWTSFLREVAVAKKVSDRAAHAEVALAHRLLGHHPVLLAALPAGAVPPQRARLLVEECARYADPVAAVADRLLTDRLGSLPPWRIKQEVALLALRLDPEAAARHEAAATADRDASLTPLPDAQAEVVLTGPAPLVVRWWDALTGRARALKAADDPRSLSALRFDLAVHTDPRELTGHDALAAACGIDDPTGATQDDSSADHQGDAGGPRRAAGQAEPDEPAEAEEPAEPLAPEAPHGSRGTPEPSPGSAVARRGLGTELPSDARCTRPVQATITVPAATALGLADEPGWLDGYGWISAPLSRSLLTAAELRKACVAPHSGQLLDLADRVHRPPPTPDGLRRALSDMVLTPHVLRPTATDSQPQHDPSPSLEALVHARDRWCDGPTGTRTPARRTDKDHEQPWPAGPTRPSNLVSRSARTHQLKHAGWTPGRDATGTTWTSPAGQTAHVPRHDHPPPPLPPGVAPPDPDTLAASDRALTRARGQAEAIRLTSTTSIHHGPHRRPRRGRDEGHQPHGQRVACRATLLARPGARPGAQSRSRPGPRHGRPPRHQARLDHGHQLLRHRVQRRHTAALAPGVHDGPAHRLLGGESVPGLAAATEQAGVGDVLDLHHLGAQAAA